MNKSDRMSPESELHVRVSEILHYLWDPTGVFWEPWARDEYSACVPGVCKMVIDGDLRSKIAAYLSKVSDEMMGVGVNDSVAEKAAEVAVAYGKKLFERE